jgi:hypothetical protein
MAISDYPQSQRKGTNKRRYRILVVQASGFSSQARFEVGIADDRGVAPEKRLEIGRANGSSPKCGGCFWHCRERLVQFGSRVEDSDIAPHIERTAMPNVVSEKPGVLMKKNNKKGTLILVGYNIDEVRIIRGDFEFDNPTLFKDRYALLTIKRTKSVSRRQKSSTEEIDVTVTNETGQTEDVTEIPVVDEP